MSSFFNKPEPPRVEDHPVNRAESSDTDSNSQQEKNSKPSSEKESTLVNEPIRDSTAADDSTKEAAGEDSPEVIPNQDSNKESVPQGESEKEAAKEEGQDNSSGDTNAEPKDDAQYPSGWRLFLITVALCLCVFCTALVRSQVLPGLFQTEFTDNII